MSDPTSAINLAIELAEEIRGRLRNAGLSDASVDELVMGLHAGMRGVAELEDEVERLREQVTQLQAAKGT